MDKIWIRFGSVDDLHLEHICWKNSHIIHIHRHKGGSQRSEYATATPHQPLSPVLIVAAEHICQSQQGSSDNPHLPFLGEDGYMNPKIAVDLNSVCGSSTNRSPLNIFLYRYRQVENFQHGNYVNIMPLCIDLSTFFYNALIPCPNLYVTLNPFTPTPPEHLVLHSLKANQQNSFFSAKSVQGFIQQYIILKLLYIIWQTNFAMWWMYKFP